jgi:histidinol-phosphate/aromatic aminotransferase/cobyric acid decarboxylase-like protein
MPEPAYAVIDIRCDPAKLPEIEAIPNLRVAVSPEYTDDPAIILVHAFADEQARAAVEAMGCAVTVVTSAEDFQQQLDDVYNAIDEDPGPIG